MLILIRHREESVCISPYTKLTVLRVIVNQVRLGIVAPKTVAVDCEEVNERKKREAAAALHPTAPGAL